jgi:peptide/nickel transport system substrate-binding protein
LSQWYKYPKPTAVYSYDPQKAKQLLAQAGYPNGFDLNMLYSPTRPGPVAEQSAILIQNMLGAIGIKVHLTEDASGTSFSSKFLAGNFDAIVWQEPPLIADPYFSASIYNISNSFQNHFGFNDPSYDKFVLSVGTTPPGAKRAKLMSQLAGLGVTDYPVIYLTDDFFMQGFRSNITGYMATPDGEVYADVLVKG